MLPAGPVHPHAVAVAPGIEADLRVVADVVVRVGREAEQRADGRRGADGTSRCEFGHLPLGEQAEVAAQRSTGLVQVDVIGGFDDDQGVPPFMGEDADDLRERAWIDTLGIGGGARGLRLVVQADLVFDVLRGEPIEKGSVGSIKRGVDVHGSCLLLGLGHVNRRAGRAAGHRPSGGAARAERHEPTGAEMLYGRIVRALVLREPGPASSSPLRLEGPADPEPAPDELVLGVVACAVCRTDLQLVEGDLQARRLPIVPGHQVVGRVERVGGAVTRMGGGRPRRRRLAGVHLRGVPVLHDRAREPLPGGRFTGWDRDGGYATRIAVRADFALRLPDGFDDLAAAPLLCGGVIGYRSLKVSGVQPGGRLGLFGFGASALLTLQVARHLGCEVHVRTRSGGEQRRALEFGASSAAGYDSPTPLLDAAITFAPAGDVVVTALRNVDRGGTVAINAIHLDRIPEFSYDLLWPERSLRSVANFTRADAREFLELAAAIPIRTAIETFPLEDGNEALRGLATGGLEGTAVLTMGDG